MASLRKRIGSPCWVCCFTLPDGQRTQKSTGKTNRKEALGICLEWERAADLARQGRFTEAQARQILSTIGERAGIGAIEFATVSKFLGDWIESKGASKAEGTAKRYRHTIESFLSHLGRRAGEGLAAVRPKDIETFRDKQVKEGKSAATANMAVKTLRIPFNLARRQGLILNNPADAVDLLSADQATRDTFTREQIGALLVEASNEWRGMILFGACHGLRIGDAAQLTWANIHAERQSLRLMPKKTRGGSKGRVEEYPLHPDIVSYLETLPSSDNPKAPLFSTLHARPVSGDHGLSLTFRRIMTKAGISSEDELLPKAKGKGRRFFALGFHSLRHTAISEQANRGVSREVRMKLSGHKSNVHERYTHHELDVLRAELAKVPSFLNDEAGDNQR